MVMKSLRPLRSIGQIGVAITVIFALQKGATGTPKMCKNKTLLGDRLK